MRRANRFRLILGLVAAVAVVGGSVAFLWWRLTLAQADHQAPTVILTQPLPHTQAYSGSYLAITATASGRVPIQRAELWVDGEIRASQESPFPNGISPFHAVFSLLLTDGTHTLMVRAANSAGLIGQSLPCDLVAINKPAPGQAFELVTVPAGQTPAQVAQAMGADPGKLPALNPDLPNLGNSPVPTDTQVVVPAPPEKQAPNGGPEPGGDNAGGAGGAEGGNPGNGGGAGPGGGNGGVPGGGAPPPDVPPLQIIEPDPISVGLPSLDGLLMIVLRPPAAPTGLQATIQDCKVRLVWNDNADNEDHYEVWMGGAGLQPRALKSLKPSSGSATWFEFPAPGPGQFVFWVMAVNAVGKQASNPGMVAVPPNCATTLATKLTVLLSDLTFSGNADKLYCYVSFENAPEVRVPPSNSPSPFLEPFGGGNWGIIPPPPPGLPPGVPVLLTGDLGSFAAPLPADNVLDVSGECWAWAGSVLKKLGVFDGHFTSKDWDGASRVLDAGVFKVIIRIGMTGTLQLAGSGEMYGFEDPSLPLPYAVTEDHYRYIWPPPNYDPLIIKLQWKWNGDQNKITGFVVYLNGAPFTTVYDRTARFTDVRLPGDCGNIIKWQVAAFADTAQSPPSAPLEYAQPPCQAYAAVRFDDISFIRTSDGWPGGNCDDVDAYYLLGVNEANRNFYGGNFFMPLKCKSYSLADIGAESGIAHPDTVVVPVDPAHPFTVDVRAVFWDHDDWSSDDLLANHQAQHMFASWQDARDLLGCGKEFKTDVSITGEGDSFLYYTLMIFPNPCQSAPPYFP